MYINEEVFSLKIKVGVSNRHVHLNREDIDILFGKGYELSVLFELTQPGLFAAEERVVLKGPKGHIEKVRIVGPLRNYTQIEVSRTDAKILGVNPPIRDSGDLGGSAPITLIGPQGSVRKKEGCIIAARHIHTNFDDGISYNAWDIVKLGFGDMVMTNVMIKKNDKFVLELHIDKDDARKFGLKNKDIIDFKIGE